MIDLATVIDIIITASDKVITASDVVINPSHKVDLITYQLSQWDSYIQLIASLHITYFAFHFMANATAFGFYSGSGADCTCNTR